MSYLEKIRCLTEILFPFKTCVFAGLAAHPGPSQVCQVVGPLGGIGPAVSPAWRGLYTGGVLYLGIVSGVTGALVPPCRLQGRALQAPSAPASAVQFGVCISYGEGGNLWLHVTQSWCLGFSGIGCVSPGRTSVPAHLSLK